MLVQLSPWQTTKTSLSLGITSPSSSRRRKRSSSTSSIKDTPEVKLLPCTASFVISQKRIRQSKRRKSSSELLAKEEPIPTLVITSSHRVDVVCRVLSKSSPEDLQESSQLQYSSRPGDNSTFYQEISLVNGSSSTKASDPIIPAVFDARHERVFAVQNKNTSLCCWHATEASGPDDATAARWRLPSPAASLSVVSQKGGIAYGSCLDGTFFVARWNDADSKTKNQGSLSSETFVSLVPKGANHICTIMSEVDKDESGSGRKRKASTDKDVSFAIHQVFCDEKFFLLVKREIRVTNKDGRLVYQAISDSSLLCKVSAIPTGLEEASLDSFHVIPCQLDDASLALAFRVTPQVSGKKQMDKSDLWYAIRISLESAQASLPFGLPSTTRQAGGITSSMLAIGTIDEILLYDVVRGTLISAVPLTEVMGDSKEWKLVCDAKKSRLAILANVSDELQVSLATLTLDGSKTNSGLSLAAGLRSSRELQLLEQEDDCSLPTNLLELLDEEGALSPAASSCPDQQQVLVSRAIACLQECLDQILDPANSEMESHFFLEAYESAVGIVLDKKKQDGNPQNGLNGIKAKKAHSHQMTRAITPATVPQDFVDGAMNIVLATLQLRKIEDKTLSIRVMLARLDARMILSRLIRTGKVSARRHFESSFNVEDDESDAFLSILRAVKLSKKRGSRVISPVDIMHEMLSSCPDVTERHMVTMIHYMLCRALPEDIAENFMDWKRLDAIHPYKQLSKQFFSTRSSLRKLQKVDEQSSATKEARALVDDLSTKVLRAGASFLVQRIVQYSNCNEALLRNALLRGLPMSREPALLSKILLGILSANPSLAAMKWIFVLCEACRDRLKDADGRSTVDNVLDTVKAIIRDNDAAVKLNDVLYRASTAEEDSLEVKKVELVEKPKEKPSQPPAYSIERLVF